MIDDEERKKANEINTKIYNDYKSVTDKTVWKEEEPQNISPVGEAYIKMQERIEKFIEQRTLMLAGVSHDLRTPLTRIKLQLEMLSKNKENEELLKDVDEMQYMLETYLDFSQTVSSEESSLVNINKLIEEVIDTSRDENKSIIFKPIGKNEINHKCKYIALKRCIINIINNAKAYGDKIIIKLSESDNKININIEDNGPGISKKDYQKALKPFQRLDSSRNQNIAGSGLGLSISQDIIKTLDGDLSLSKSEIGGLKVEINLPKIS